ncbi:MAG: WD40 repeat domain-containing protein [Janthinobacterium lividum]
MSQVRTPVRPGLPSPLADLLGARWTMGVPVTAAAWFDRQNAVGFGLADGTLAIIRAQWDGAATVQPREGGGVEVVPARGQPPPAIRARVHAGPCLCVAAGEGVVLSGGRDGDIARTRPDGTFEVLSGRSDGGVGCMATGKGGAWAYAVGSRVHRIAPAPAVLDLPGQVSALAFDPTGQDLAIAQSGSVWLWPAGADPAQWPLGGGLMLDGYPEPVLALSFSAPGGFLAVSGAPRILCWHPGGQNGAGRRTECGIAGPAVVSQVACHPTRVVIAAGYSNGVVLLCQPGSPDILFVRSAGGGAVTTLAWSPDGAALALGTALGEAGVVALPSLLFRSAGGAPPDAADPEVLA